MTLKIVCFEDSERSREHLVEAFKSYNADIMFFSDPGSQWNITTELARKIEEFDPTFIIVDLKDDKGSRKEAGLRTIRQLNDFFTDRFPIIAWSVLLTNDRSGQRYISYVLEGGAKPLFKSKNRRTSATRFLSLVGMEI